MAPLPVSSLHRRTARYAGVFLLSTLAVLVPAAHAQDYPAKPIQWIVPYSPGSASDATARIVANEMSSALGQPIVVTNRPGAGGLIGSAAAARAPADGYTVLVGSFPTHVLNPLIYKNLPYDPLKDFVPVTRIISADNVLAVPASLNVKDLSELIALARQRADRPLAYGNAGNGSSAHVATEQFRRLAGIELLAVPYPTIPAVLNDMLAGRIDLVFGNINVVLPHVKSGSLRVLAIAAKSRSPLLPDVPTFRELGMPEQEMSVWSGLFLPAGASQPVASKLNAAARTALTSAAVQQALSSSGVQVETDGSPDEFAAVLRADIERWTPIVKAMGVHLE